ncbi:MAG TPA: rRNA maturation RNase YbeY [Actinomycetota bacterium]
MSDDPSSRPTILISNRQDLPVDEPALTRLARESLRAEGQPDVELSVSLVTRDEIADLHERYLGEPGPTDVLSFPQDDEAEDGVRLLGDVVVCPEEAAEQEGAEADVGLLLVHGILHLLGYDHETDEDRAEMWARQARYAGVPMEGSS